MATASNTLQLVIQVQNNASGPIGQVNNSLQSLGQQTINITQRASTAFNGLSSLIQGLATGAIARAGYGILKLAGDFEVTRTGIRTLVGDITQADALIKDLQIFAANSPFTFKGLQDSGKQLLAFGFQAKEILPTLQAVSAASSALGLSQEGIDRITYALGQIKSAGRLFATEARQLFNANIPVFELLAKGYGTSAEKIQRAISEGFIKGDDAVRVIVQGLQSKFGPTLAQISRSFNVTVSNLVDDAQRVGRALGDVFLGQAGDAVTGLRGKLSSLEQVIRENPEHIRFYAGALADLAKVIITYQIATKIAEIGIAMSNLQQISKASLLGAVVTTLVVAGNEVRKTKDEFVTLFDTLRASDQAAGTGGLMSDLSGILKGLGVDTTYLREALDGLGTGFSVVKQSVTSAVTDLASIVPGLGLIKGGLHDINEAIAEMGGRMPEIPKSFGEFVSRAAGALNEAFGNGGEKPKKILRIAPEIADGLKRVMNGTFDGMRATAQKAIDDSQQKMAKFAANTEAMEKKIASAEKETREAAIKAASYELTSLQKLNAERREKLQLYREEGTLTAKVRANINQEFNTKQANELLKIQKEARKEAIDSLKEGQQLMELKRDGNADRFKLQQQYELQAAEMGMETDRKRFESQVEAARAAGDQQLRALDLVDAQTVQQKLILEQTRFRITEATLTKITALEIEAIKRRTDFEILQLETLKIVRPEAAKQIDQLIGEYRRAALEDERAANQKLTQDVTAARQEAAVRQVQIQRDANRQVFDSFKSQADSLLDQILTKSKSMGEAIAGALKAAFLTAIKDVLSSRIAAMLTQLTTGQKVTLQPGGGAVAGGPFGGLLKLLGLGAIPQFGGSAGSGGGSVPFATPPFVSPGTASVGAAGQAGAGGAVPFYQSLGFSSPTDFMKAMGGLGPGGTAPFVGGRSTTSTGTSGILGNLSGLKGFFGQGNHSVQVADGVATTSNAFSLKALGKSDAALAGGAFLAYDGLKRGGITGLVETTAGGALIGYKFGGPIGALIGGAVGATAGLIRLFVKGAAEKAVEKVKKLYSINIDKKFAEGLIDLAKQRYLGNLDVALQSREVRDLLTDYAMATGQNFGGVRAPQATSATLSTSGGSFSVDNGYLNGSANTSFGIPKLAAAPSTVASQAVPSVVVQASFTMPGDAVNEAFNGRTIGLLQTESRTVAASTLKGQQASVGRLESAATAWNPAIAIS